MPDFGARYYVGIDPSATGTGIGLLQCKGKVQGRFVHRISTKELRGPKRLQFIRDSLLFFIQKFDCQGLVRGVCIEGPSLRSTNQSDTLGQVRGVLELASLDHLALPIEIPPTSLKKFATGNGHASKEKMIQNAHLQGWNVTNDDEADAAWLAEFAWALHDNSLPLTRKQLEAIRGIRNIGHPKTQTPIPRSQINI